jgi:hypothetical protein
VIRLPLKYKRRPGEKALFALVDAVDWRMAAINWRAQRTSTGKFYAVHNVTLGKPIQRTLYLHREILQASTGTEVDHRNGDTLDCRRENLRLATHAQNARNTKTPVSNTTGFKGVRRIKTKWTAYIKIDGKQRHLGCFTSKREAARAYDAAAQQAWGEFARPNKKRGDA